MSPMSYNILLLFSLIMQVREDLMRGDVDGAQRSSADAYRLSKWAIAVGVIFSVVSFVIIFVIFFQRWSYMY